MVPRNARFPIMTLRSTTQMPYRSRNVHFLLQVEIKIKKRDFERDTHAKYISHVHCQSPIFFLSTQNNLFKKTIIYIRVEHFPFFSL